MGHIVSASIAAILLWRDTTTPRALLAFAWVAHLFVLTFTALIWLVGRFPAVCLIHSSTAFSPPTLIRNRAAEGPDNHSRG